MKKILKALKNPKVLLRIIIDKPFVSRFFSDKCYIKLMYRLHLGKRPDIENPRTYNEKLQWIKLYDRRDEYTMMADKYEVRKYVADKIGEEYLIPLLGVWDRAEDIDFDKLPDKFVLKCNHNSGKGMCICKDKSKLDIANVRRELSDGLKEKYFYKGREWPYKNIKPRIVCEKYMESSSGDLKDYKFMCYNGEPKHCFVFSDRFSESGAYLTVFDTNWERVTLSRPKFDVRDIEISKPVNFEKMIEFACVFSEGIPFSRIDFYEVDGKIYFGEITFFPSSGFQAFEPENWDDIMGSWITLPEKKVEK